MSPLDRANIVVELSPGEVAAETTVTTTRSGGAGMVTRISVLLDGYLPSMTEPARTALRVGLLNTLENASALTFDRSNIVVELSEFSPLRADAFFKPGSGVGITEAEEIADAIMYEGSEVVTDDGAAYAIYSVAVTEGTLAPTPSPSPAPTPSPSPAPSFSPAVAGAVPRITALLEGNSASLTGLELAALKAGFLNKLQAASGAFDTDSIVVEMSSAEPAFVAEVFFMPGSGVGIAEAHAIVAAIQYEGSIVVTPEGSQTDYEIIFLSAEHAAPPQTVAPSLTPTPSPSPAPSFSPAVAGAVPTIAVFISGNSATLTELELAALKAGFLNKLQAASEVPFDRANIVVEMSSAEPAFMVEAFFMPGSGVGIAEAHAIVAAIQYEGSVVTPEGSQTDYEIIFASAEHAAPPQTVAPTLSPTRMPTRAPTTTSVAFTNPTRAPATSKPSRSPTPSLGSNPSGAPSFPPPTPVPTCPPTSSFSAQDYCPCGYHDYGVRYSLGLGRITIVSSHQECADRCTTFSGPEYSGGCRGVMTGMYMNMLFCRSYGSVAHATACAAWASPTHPGMNSGPLGTHRPQTNQFNVGGNCCSNTTFVDIGFDGRG